jgi:hypothetical protein
MPRRLEQKKPRSIKQEEKIKSPQRIILREVTDAEIIADQKRERLMFVSVGVIMALVLLVWFINIQSAVRVTAFGDSFLQNVVPSQEKFSLDAIQSQSLIAQLKQLTSQTMTASTSDSLSSTTVATTSEIYNTNLTEVNGLVNKIINKSTTTINNQ